MKLFFFIAIFLYFYNLAHAAATPREIDETSTLKAKEIFNRLVGANHGRKAFDAKLDKEKWKAAKDSTSCFPWKQFCGWKEKRYRKKEERQSKKEGEYQDEQIRVSRELNNRRKDYQEHKELLQHVQGQNPRANNRLALSKSLKQVQEQTPKADRHLTRSKSS